MVEIVNLEESLQRYQGFLQQDPNNPHLIAKLVDLQLQAGYFEDARVLLAHGLDHLPDEPGLLFRRATLALATGELECVVAVLNTLLSQGHSASAIYYNLAYAYLLQGNVELAKHTLDVMEDNNDVAAIPERYLLRGRILHHLGDLDHALQVVLHYIETNSETAEAMGLLALLYFDKGESETAQQWAQKVLNVDANSHEALVTSGSLALEQQDIRNAGVFFSQVMENHPESGRACLGQGLVAMAQQNLQLAHEYLKKAVQFMPNHLGTWNTLAWCEIFLGDFKGAKATLDRAMSIDHNFAETHGTLAVIAVYEGRLEEAKRITKRALGLNPNSFAARYAQSLLLAQAGKEKMSAKLMEKILASEVEAGKGTIQDALLRLQRQQSTQADRGKNDIH